MKICEKCSSDIPMYVYINLNLNFWVGLCVPIIHFDSLRCTVWEILANIVGTGSIDHRPIPIIFTSIS